MYNVHTCTSSNRQLTAHHLSSSIAGIIAEPQYKGLNPHRNIQINNNTQYCIFTVVWAHVYIACAFSFVVRIQTVINTIRLCTIQQLIIAYGSFIYCTCTWSMNTGRVTEYNYYALWHVGLYVHVHGVHVHVKRFMGC